MAEAGPFFEAYNAMATCRRFEGGPIPQDAAMAYADRKGLEPDVADAMWTVIRRMDIAERQWRYDQLKAETGG